MSLAPGEQRALAGIENALRDSDPRLTAMLATFTPPLTSRLRISGDRLAQSRRGRILAAAAALAAVCVLVLTWLLPSSHGRPACSPGQHAGAQEQLSACQHPAGAAGPWDERGIMAGRWPGLR